MLAVSIIIPCYNASSKIGKCFSSLRGIEFSKNYEVIFVDDKSTDSTFEILKSECSKEKNWHCFRLSKNSGSPSQPRNEGVRKAQGQYIFYLDCDDEILSDTLEVHYHHAIQTNACVVRGALLVDNGIKRIRMNVISDWDSKLPNAEKITKIISKQSTTTPQLIRRDLLIKHKVEWQATLRMGEDTVFLADVLAHALNIEYVQHDTFIYNKRPSFTLSTTQSYGKRDLLDHLYGWEYVQNKLIKVKVDYSKIRLSVGIQNVFKSLIFKNRRDIDAATFEKFSDFIIKNKSVIDSYKLSNRYREIVDTLLTHDFDKFIFLCRPRMVIASHDLKFIMPVENQLKQLYDIKYDKWMSHTGHDENESKKLLEWAELVWCEWMLGNSLWYSKNKKSHQKLIIRMHRQELGTEYATDIDFNQVDLVFAVSVLFFERMLEKFPNIPRHKVRLLLNYIDVDAYQKDWDEEKLYNLAMIGVLPAKKNLKAGLEVLKLLKAIDPRFKLSIYGKKAAELAWLMRIESERNYFQDCEEFIKDNKLQDSVIYRGHLDLKTALSEDKIGYVLSLSESVKELPGFESFHLAVADGYASGAISLIRKWAGCEYIFPQYMLHDSIEEIVNTIKIFNSNHAEYLNFAQKGRDFISQKYSHKIFISQIDQEISLL